MKYVHIKDIRVGVLQEDGTGKQLPVTDSPFYRSLADNDPSIFEAYYNVLQKVSGTPEKEMRWYNLLNLKGSIEKLGLDMFMESTSEPIRFDGELTCLDGHHRLSVFRNIFGPQILLGIEDNILKEVWVKSKK